MSLMPMIFKNALLEKADSTRIEKLNAYFKVCDGGYGEGDQFIGVRVPEIRRVCQCYYTEFSLQELEFLLRDMVHEYRMSALFMFQLQFKHSKDSDFKRQIIVKYLENLDYVNNWDLVDASAAKLLGEFAFDNSEGVNWIDILSQSKLLWRERVAIISTHYFIKRDKFQLTLKLAENYLTHKHDLIHKAVGWMLREIGERNRVVLENFLVTHYKNMPRTTLRYAIEKLSLEEKKAYMTGEK